MTMSNPTHNGATASEIAESLEYEATSLREAVQDLIRRDKADQIDLAAIHSAWETVRDLHHQIDNGG